MGIDLTLLPVKEIDGTWGFAHTILELDRDYELHDRIRALDPQQRVGFNLSSYVALLPNGERGYGDVHRNPYGEPITYVDSQRLYEAMAAALGDAPLSVWNAAAADYIHTMPRGMVALFWH